MILKAAGLYQVRNKMSHRYKLVFMILALIFNSTALHAEVYTCEINEKGVQDRYDLKYVQIDTTQGNARFGNDRKWFGNYKVSTKNAGTGIIHSWSQELTVTYVRSRDKGKKMTRLTKLRLKKDGGYDLMMSKPGRSWNLDANCKID